MLEHTPSFNMLIHKVFMARPISFFLACPSYTLGNSLATGPPPIPKPWAKIRLHL